MCVTSYDSFAPHTDRGLQKRFFWIMMKQSEIAKPNILFFVTITKLQIMLAVVCCSTRVRIVVSG